MCRQDDRTSGRTREAVTNCQGATQLVRSIGSRLGRGTAGYESLALVVLYRGGRWTSGLGDLRQQGNYQLCQG